MDYHNNGRCLFEHSVRQLELPFISKELCSKTTKLFTNPPCAGRSVDEICFVCVVVLYVWSVAVVLKSIFAKKKLTKN